MQEQRKLRNFLIQQQLQTRITIKFVILAFLFALMGEVLVYLVGLPAFRSVSGANFPLLLFWYNIPLVVIIIIAGIVITHKVAGPVYKIEQTLDQIIEEEKIVPIRLRDGDELRELADKINILLTRYHDLKHGKPHG